MGVGFNPDYPQELKNLESKFIDSPRYNLFFQCMQILYDHLTPNNKYTATINENPECDIEFRFCQFYTDPIKGVFPSCKGNKSKARNAVFFIIMGDYQVLEEIMTVADNKKRLDQFVNDCKAPGAHGEWAMICHNPSIDPSNSSPESAQKFNAYVKHLLSRLDDCMEQEGSSRIHYPTLITPRTDILLTTTHTPEDTKVVATVLVMLIF